jgi:hypothetical protein
VNDQLNDITVARFEALAGYCRHPHTLLSATEVRWLQACDEAILVVVIRDHEDNDFAALLLAQDLKDRYRFFHMSSFFPTPEEALATVPELVTETLAELETDRAQGDEKGRPVDFFTPVVPKEKLNADFEKLSTLEQYSPALELIKPMMKWYEDADGNFVEQFQTAGFDTRFWELYIFAMLVEARYALDKANAIPDFCAANAFGKICVEATSVNPSLDLEGNRVPPPPLDTPEQMIEFQRNYMPIRFAGPLTAKLSKKYWEKKNVSGLPLLLAIQDFHAPGSMVYSRTALPIYLYGMDWDFHHTEAGKLIVTPRPVVTHQWGTKIIASGFFSFPGAENISAVITNASATISKFNRMGILASFGSKRVRMIRKGTIANGDANASSPITFTHDVNSPGYTETWMEGLDVYHNPNATNPLHPEMLPGAAHHRLLKDGQLQSLAPAWHPFGSASQIFLKD